MLLFHKKLQGAFRKLGKSRSSGCLGLLAVPYQIEEFLMDAQIRGQLGMEGGGHGFTLANQNRVVSFGGQYFDRGPQTVDLGSANKDHLDRVAAKQTLANGAVDLTAVGV